MSNELNKNKWHHVQTDDRYTDFEKRIASFEDEAHSAVDMRLTFDRKNDAAYIVLSGIDDEMQKFKLEAEVIPVGWEDAKEMLAKAGVDASPLVRRTVLSSDIPVPEDPFNLCFTGVASTPDWAIEDKSGRTICEFSPTTTRTAGVTKQRAHMMAAAPALASTLSAALREIQKLSPSHPLIPKVVATLATAFAGEPGEAAAEVAAANNSNEDHPDFGSVVGEGFIPPELYQGDLPKDAWQRQLKTGDRVYWMDPNDGAHSREYIVQKVPVGGITGSTQTIALVDPLTPGAEYDAVFALSICVGELGRLDTQMPPIPAKMMTDDHVAMVEFDASKWFMNAPDSAIIALAEQGWGGDDRADGVAESFDEGGHHPNPQIAAAFAYLNAARNFKTVGFECYIAKDEAMAWIQSRRPALFDKINTEALAPAP